MLRQANCGQSQSRDQRFFLLMKGDEIVFLPLTKHLLGLVHRTHVALISESDNSKLPRASSISVYGQGKAQAFHNSKNADRSSDSGSFSSIDLEDRPHPLAFAEATYDPSLPMKTKSRLSKDLQEVLHDNSALAYFIQFLDAHKAKHLVKFWLEAESFRSSFEIRRKSQNLGTVNNKDNDSPSENVFHDSSQAAGQKLNTCEESVNIKNMCIPVSDNLNDLLSVQEDSCSKSSKVQASLSVDSGCDEKVITNNVLKGKLKRGERCVNESETLATKVLCDKSSYDSLELDQDIEVTSSKEKNSDLLEDSIVRLKTSIEQDAYAIYSKYISCDAASPIGVDEELRSLIKNNLNQSSGPTTSLYFVPAQDFVVKRMDKEYFPSFLRSSFHCKHQIDVLTSGTVYLADVLYNDSAVFFFMEFMEQEHVRHLVDFLLMADNFQKHLLSQGKYDGMQAQADAMVIYEKYFSLQATIPLGYSDQVRYEVEANICREEGPLPDCFLKPVKILTQYLEKTYLLQFLNSQLYFKYISECIIIIQTGGTEVDQQKYPGSDSGSEQSLPISSINTLLAMDSKQMGASKIIKNIGDQDMRIDLMQFKPDALWKRPQAGKLQMAHVDHLGRVTVDFEPEPDRRRESRISKAVKKLVNWEEDKNQEDMAWKVAEMIVKDVCSVTMAESEKSTPEKKPS